MKILLINGSPKGEQSNSLKLANAFIEGLGEDNDLHIRTLAKLHQEPCKGCFACWNKTPGKTNRILAMSWGILYVLIAVWSAIMMPGGYTAVVQIANNTATILMGIFTLWFQRWYPAHMASGH